MQHLTTTPAEVDTSYSKYQLFVASFVALYFELLIIRYLGTEIRVFAYLKNFPLIACFLGIGLGMIYGACPKRLKRAFLIVLPALLACISFAGPLHLTEIGFPQFDYKLFGSTGYRGISGWTQLGIFLTVSMAVLSALVCVFTVLGCHIGKWFSRVTPLVAYSINLAGSLAGLVTFTVLSFLRLPPCVWLGIGLLSLLPLLWHQKRALLPTAAVVLLTAMPQPLVTWSPYYRIDLTPGPVLAGSNTPAVYFLTVNHQIHQRILDLSHNFFRDFGDVEPNASAKSNYELPYELVDGPKNVLIVGAGTGNDVAAAIRHNALHVDAVEIDPAIADIGKRYHPEHPYQSPRVTLYVNDARAFFKNSTDKYDLILFAYLDSHTMLTAFSSVRLDNYVYTSDSFTEAKRLLKPNGTMMVAFNSGRDFVDQRIFATLTRTFGREPYVYETHYDGRGLLYVEGQGWTASHKDVRDRLRSSESVIVPTDNWPFLYLYSRSIPFGFAIVLVLFVGGMTILVKKALPVAVFSSAENIHFLLLGCGFLLLETAGVTRMALLFGSTWITNAVVIGAFLLMAIIGNMIVMLRPVPLRLAYAGLFVTIILGMLFPYSALEHLGFAYKTVSAGIVVGLPVLFSGIVFSRCLRQAQQPAAVLGVNLLGAMAGGALENAVMIGGTKILWELAMLVYCCAATALVVRKRPTLNEDMVTVSRSSYASLD